MALIRACFKGLIAILVFVSLMATAGVPAWNIVPNESSINFTATQNNSPVSGTFKAFTGDIHFDPAQLNASNVTITVDLASVTTSYAEVADTLKMADWFDVKNHPQAVFKASKFSKVSDNNYKADGTLTIRDKTLPITLTFIVDQFTPSNLHLKGSAVLKRTDFGVGQGDWAKTDAVKDEVQVNFILSAMKK